MIVQKEPLESPVKASPINDKPKLTHVTLEFKDISYQVTVPSKNGRLFKRKGQMKQILSHISGSVQPGDLVALIGASGAGKSTLLNILSRRITSNDGEVLINGIPADRSPVLTSSTCFIQQDDIFHGFITVHEHLKQQARFRMPLPEAEQFKRVQTVMDRFSLNKTKNSPIGNVAQGASRGISGGERKRLSVATELLTNPSLIFADEPTSGLDAFMAESVVEALRFLAQSGHTVISTIHQPSSDVFAMFNKLLLMSEGRLLYFGPCLGAIPYFVRLGHPCPPYTNPADFLIELLAIDWEDPTEKLEEIERWTEHWNKMGPKFLREWETDLELKFHRSLIKSATFDLEPSTIELTKEKPLALAAPNSIASHEIKPSLQPGDSEGTVASEELFQLPTNPDGYPKRVSRRTILSTLLERSIISASRNPAVVRARTVQVLFTAILGGLVYFRLSDTSWYSRAGACFFILINQGFMMTFTAITGFMGDKTIVIRERDGGLYSLSTYYGAKILSDLMFQFYLPLIYIVVAWFMIGFNDTAWRFFAAAGYLFLTALGISSIGYIVAAIAPHMGVAVALGPILLLPFMMVAGFIIQRDSLPKFWLWLYYLSPFVYAFSSFMRCIFYNVTYPSVEGTISRTGNEILMEFGISTNEERWIIDAVALLAWIIGGRLFAWVLFIYANRKRRR